MSFQKRTAHLRVGYYLTIGTNYIRCLYFSGDPKTNQWFQLSKNNNEPVFTVGWNKLVWTCINISVNETKTGKSDINGTTDILWFATKYDALTHLQQIKHQLLNEAGPLLT
jgi:hypothetical protein